ncbi:hypothetical protein HNQ80_004250 [Anaerosolibacter carboniphilus]|uniref:Uncharacterized protein n=1 Tax=Anaerosolibacter carboniphilus TaxID=1417629 RepID=A0A841L1Q9_9FIRM|nr:hypothetical protein [Anaerosolibacter carboniphilus]
MKDITKIIDLIINGYEVNILTSREDSIEITFQI